jgi:hypothetical protein
MKNNIIFLLCFFWLTVVLSQEAEKKSWIGFSIGPSFPIGDYGNQDFEDPKAGLARIGFNLNLDVRGKFNENLGFNFLILIADHHLNEEKMTRAFQPMQPYLNWKVNSDPWGAAGIFGGILISLPQTDNLDLTFRALLGYMGLDSPYYRVTATADAKVYVIEQSDATVNAWGSYLGVGMKLDLSHRFSLSFNLDHCAATGEFETDINTNFSGSYDGSFEQRFTFLNLSVAAAYKFNRLNPHKTDRSYDHYIH